MMRKKTQVHDGGPIFRQLKMFWQLGTLGGSGGCALLAVSGMTEGSGSRRKLQLKSRKAETLSSVNRRNWIASYSRERGACSLVTWELRENTQAATLLSHTAATHRNALATPSSRNRMRSNHSSCTQRPLMPLIAQAVDRSCI